MAGPLVNDFSRGALGPTLKGRWDLPIYRRGAQKLRNMIVMPMGGAMKIPGTTYVCEPKATTDAPRLTTFIVDAAHPYILEWGALSLRFYKGGSRLGAPTEVTTPYSITEDIALKFAEKNTKGVLFIFHEDYDPRLLTWTSDTSWALSTPTWTGQTFTGSGNRPHAGCRFQRRLWVLKGTSLYASRVSAMLNFTVGALDTHAIEVALGGIAAGSVPLWLAALDNELIIGCVEGLIRVFASDGGAVTPSTVSIDRVSDVGVSSTQGVANRDRLLFVSRDGKSLMEYNPASGSGEQPVRNLSLLADQIFTEEVINNNIREIVVQQAPQRIIWCMAGNGNQGVGSKLAGLTYEPENDIMAWHDHDVSTYLSSIAVAPPASTGIEDTVMIAAKHGSAWLIEKFGQFRWWLNATSAYARIFVRCGVLDTAYVSGSLSGFPSALNGETVKVVKNGVTDTDAVVSGGAITPSGAGVIVAGLAYTATIAPMPLMLTDRAGRLLQRVTRAIARFWRTLTFEAGPNETDLESQVIATDATPANNEVSDVVLDSGFSQDADIYLVNSEPQPFAVLSIQPDVESEEA